VCNPLLQYLIGLSIIHNNPANMMRKSVLLFGNT
jgi:hypothetical protein